MQRHQDIATKLRLGRATFAGYASAELLSPVDATAKAMGGFREWQSFLESRIAELAAALDAGRPGIFTSQVRWCVKAMESRGVSRSEIARALQTLGATLATELRDEGKTIQQQYIAAAIQSIDSIANDDASLLDSSTTSGRTISEYVLAILEGDRRRACECIHRAVEEGLSIRDAYHLVVEVAGREIGRMWQMDEISIAEEHFATTTSQMVMAQLFAKAEFQPRNGKTLMATCVAGNRHDLGLRLVADLVEISGWRVIYLGTDVPLPDIVRAVQDFQPDMLLLSVSLCTQLRAFELTCRALSEAFSENSPAIVAGGAAFAESPELAIELGAHHFAPDADRVLELAKLLAAPAANH